MLEDRLLRWLLRPTLDNGQSVTSPLPIAIATDIGKVRKENQDRVAVMRVFPGGSTSPFLVVALADGMGGMRDGERCAALTLSAFFAGTVKYRGKTPITRIAEAAKFANEKVFEHAGGRGGATLSAILVDMNGNSYLVNVGDSRIYATLKGGASTKLLRLTKDDSLAEKVGGESRDLLQFIGMGAALTPTSTQLSPDSNYLFLMSDGIHFLGTDTLTQIISNCRDIEEAASRLLTTANWFSGHDNATIATVMLSEIWRAFERQDSESGLEVWDPFGAVQIMWMAEPTSRAVDDGRSLGRSKKPSVDEDLPSAKPPSNKKRTKSKRRQRSNKTRDLLGTQFKVDIED